MRRLSREQAYKPLDFGNGLVAGSVPPDGRLLTLNTYHPVHGYITLSAFPGFPDDSRHDQTAVRRYRAALAQPDAPTFGLRLDGDTVSSDAFLLADAVPHSRMKLVPEGSPDDTALSVEVTTWAPRHDGAPLPGLLQLWRLHNPSSRPVSVGYVWDGHTWLRRASYTQLTERGRLPTSTTMQQLSTVRGGLRIIAPELGAAAVVRGLPPDSAWQQADDGGFEAMARGELKVPAAGTIELCLIVALDESVSRADETARALQDIDPQRNLDARLDDQRRRWRDLNPKLPDRARLLAHRALAYVWDCCALPVGEGICLLTDHQILPLGWTRDAYYLVDGLSAADRSALALMRRHLIWLFEIAARPDGHWGRAYLANGQPKDQIFQLDQQCYPLLELAHYAAAAGDDTLVSRLSRHVPAVLDAILARRAGETALFATDETPADDPVPLPYHFSSQVLLWYTLRNLAFLNETWSFTSIDLTDLADAVRAAIWAHLAVENEGRRLFAYAVDLQGNSHLYHDANDLPAVWAPVWGFCSAGDTTWQATLDFAFSVANAGGYYSGPLSGLGSVHTPGPWPLGDVQEFVYARLTGDGTRARAVLDRLVATATWDGALPEARDAISGAVRSRHWFAWPGMALVSAMIADIDQL